MDETTERSGTARHVSSFPTAVVSRIEKKRIKAANAAADIAVAKFSNNIFSQ